MVLNREEYVTVCSMKNLISLWLSMSVSGGSKREASSRHIMPCCVQPPLVIHLSFLKCLATVRGSTPRVSFIYTPSPNVCLPGLLAIMTLTLWLSRTYVWPLALCFNISMFEKPFENRKELKVRAVHNTVTPCR